MQPEEIIIQNPDQNNPPSNNQENPPENPPSQDTSGSIDVLNSALRESFQRSQLLEQRNRELEEQLNRSSSSTSTTPEPTNEDFYSNPIDAIRRIVLSQTAPLNQFTEEIRKQNLYNSVIAQVATIPPYDKVLPHVRAQLDAIFPSKVEPTVTNVINAINTIVGQYSLANINNIPQNNTSTSQNPTQNNSMPNAHLRPSGSAPKNQVNDDKPWERYNWTENELRLMRANNMSKEEWWKYMNTPAIVGGK